MVLPRNGLEWIAGGSLPRRRPAPQPAAARPPSPPPTPATKAPASTSATASYKNSTPRKLTAKVVPSHTKERSHVRMFVESDSERESVQYDSDSLILSETSVSQSESNKRRRNRRRNRGKKPPVQKKVNFQEKHDIIDEDQRTRKGILKNGGATVEYEEEQKPQNVYLECPRCRYSWKIRKVSEFDGDDENRYGYWFQTTDRLIWIHRCPKCTREFRKGEGRVVFGDSERDRNFHSDSYTHSPPQTKFSSYFDNNNAYNSSPRRGKFSTPLQASSANIQRGNNQTQPNHQQENMARFISRTIEPRRAVVIIREDVIETTSDPIPNAFFDSASGFLRVYHGPIYGNPLGSLSHQEPSYQIGANPSAPQWAGRGGAGTFMMHPGQPGGYQAGGPPPGVRVSGSGWTGVAQTHHGGGPGWTNNNQTNNPQQNQNNSGNGTWNNDNQQQQNNSGGGGGNTMPGAWQDNSNDNNDNNDAWANTGDNNNDSSNAWENNNDNGNNPGWDGQNDNSNSNNNDAWGNTNQNQNQNQNQNSPRNSNASQSGNNNNQNNRRGSNNWNQGNETVLSGGSWEQNNNSTGPPRGNSGGGGNNNTSWGGNVQQAAWGDQSMAANWNENSSNQNQGGGNSGW